MVEAIGRVDFNTLTGDPELYMSSYLLDVIYSYHA
jgi:hypothetical protein